MFKDKNNHDDEGQFDSDGEFDVIDEGSLPKSTEEFIQDEEQKYQEGRKEKTLEWKERLKNRLRRIKARLAMIEKKRRVSAPKEWCHKQKTSFEDKVVDSKKKSPNIGR